MPTPSLASVSTSPANARGLIDTALCRDRGRLLRLFSRWKAQPNDTAARQAFISAAEASGAAREARAGQLPQAEVAPELPIAKESVRIAELIRAHQVIIIAGETGSGKTTQLPKLCLKAGRGAAGMIGCTQPRRLAARAVARRVAEELQTPLGGRVGFQVRFSDHVSENTAVKFMTDGILLAEIASDRWLSRYDTLIIDEAHERSLNIDFLLGYLKQLLPRRPDLKLIVTSATIDTARFSEHFANAPVVTVEGRGYPVEVRYRPLQENADGDAANVVDGIISACDELFSAGAMGGDALVFLPGEREIREVHQALERRKYRHTEVLPLYARLSAQSQDRVFQPGSQRRIVLATNVAETSLTVPRIHYVIDPGLARIKRYSPRQKLDRLQVEAISQASANQRAGRCGRIAPGICIRLYSEAEFLARSEYTDPEIRRSALSGVILRMLALGLAAGQHTARKGAQDPISDFPFVEPPDTRAISDGWQQLTELGAIDARRQLTAVGRMMAKLPVDVTLARMLIAAEHHGCVHEMLVIASFLGIQDPRERPAEQRAAADNAHAQFADHKSEFVGILKLWEAYRQAHEEGTQSQLRRWCERQFLGFLRMREWWELHRQLKVQCEGIWESKRPLSPNPSPTSGRGEQKNKAPLPFTGEGLGRGQGREAGADATAYATLHRALITGLPGQIGQRQTGQSKEKGQFDGPRGRKFHLFPGSTLARKPPNWVLSATVMETARVWALTNAAIEPEWAIEELPHLLSRRHFDPRWSRSQGRVIGSEQISLFGLVLAAKRPFDYGKQYPEDARAYFLRDGLVTGEINTRSRFVAANLKTLESALEEEAKQRKAGLVVDEEWLTQWYAERIPAQIIDARALDAWYGKLPPDARKTLEWSRDDLLVGTGTDATRFPEVMPLGNARLAVRYRFEPGAVDDGMTVVVPLHLLNALDPARLSWLAPGLVADKATALIRSLPKSLRRQFVPAPDIARLFAAAHTEPEPEPITAALARFLKRMSGSEISANDFSEHSLEPHLQVNLRLQDREGRHVLAESRDLEALRAEYGSQAREAFAARAARGLARSGLTSFPETPIPATITGTGGLPAWPALHDDGDSVSLTLYPDPDSARRAHPGGVRRLLAIALQDKHRQAMRQLPINAQTALRYTALEASAPRPGKAGDRLREDLVEGALSSLLAALDEDIRDSAAFTASKDRIGKALFGQAMQRLQQAERILDLVGTIRAQLDSPLIGWARANLDDMRAHLDALVSPGFLRSVPIEILSQYPRYLKALKLRSERALRDPARDQQRMLELKPFTDALTRAEREARANQPEWQALRWDLEELRVSLFAQELGARGGVSAKKLAARVSALQSMQAIIVQNLRSAVALN